MRIPWASPPTVSDAAKLGLKGQPVPITGETQYELLLQSVDSWPFTTEGDFGPFTEVDSAANIAVTGGVMTIKGTGAFNNNGAWLTTRKATSTPGAFRIKLALKTAPGICALGFNSADGLLMVRQYCWKAYTSATNEYIVGEGTVSLTATPWVNGTQYEFQFEWNPTTKTETIYRRIVGGGWSLWAHFRLDAALPANLGLQILPYTAYATAWEIDDYECLYGYATDGPTLTYVADAGSGKVFNGLVFTNLAATGSWATTNVTFAYDFSDSATPSWSSEYTLAQLNALTALTTTKRYVHLRVKVNSDGATQQYAGEINADDATAGVFTLPSAATIKKDTVINTITGTLESTDPGVANVVKDVAYIIESAAKVGTFDEAARNTDPGVTHVDVDAVASYLIQGVTKTPTLSLSAEKTAYENSRNDAAGITVADILVGKAPKIKNTTYTGTFNESTRNVDPGVAHVESPTAYRIHNSDLVGTLTVTAPTAPTITSFTPTATTMACVIDSDASVTNTIYWMAEDGTSFTAFATTIVGPGTITVTGLQAGRAYWFYAQSASAASTDGPVYGPERTLSTNGTNPVYTEVTPPAVVYTEV